MKGERQKMKISQMDDRTVVLMDAVIRELRSHSDGTYDDFESAERIINCFRKTEKDNGGCGDVVISISGHAKRMKISIEEE